MRKFNHPVSESAGRTQGPRGFFAFRDSRTADCVMGNGTDPAAYRLPLQKWWKINTKCPQVYEKVQYLDKIGLYLQFCQYIIKMYA